MRGSGGAEGVRVTPSELAPRKSPRRVRVIDDPERDGLFAGRTGSIASNELDGLVWVHLGQYYANFQTSDLDDITENP